MTDRFLSKTSRVRRAVVISGTLVSLVSLACLSAFGRSRSLEQGRQAVDPDATPKLRLVSTPPVPKPPVPNSIDALETSTSEAVSQQRFDATFAETNAASTRTDDVETERTSVYPGRVAAFKKSTPTFRVPGPLVEICVAPGQRVKKGETLMRIDPRDYRIKVDAAQAQLDAAKAKLVAMRNGARPEDVALLKTQAEEAQASFELAEKEFERAQKLVEKDAVSKSDFDVAKKTFVLAGLTRDAAQKELEKGLAGSRVEEIAAAEAEIRGLEAALESAKNSLDDATLRAPYDGEVAAKLIDVAEMVTTSPTYRQVLVVHDVSKLKVEVYLPERAMIGGDLEIGKKVGVRFTAKRANLYQAELCEIDAEPAQVGTTYKPTFVLDAPTDLRVLPGMICEAPIPEPAVK